MENCKPKCKQLMIIYCICERRVINQSLLGVTTCPLEGIGLENVVHHVTQKLIEVHCIKKYNFLIYFLHHLWFQSSSENAKSSGRSGCLVYHDSKLSDISTEITTTFVEEHIEQKPVKINIRIVAFLQSQFHVGYIL